MIENFAFTPASLRVRPGTKITVVNRDSAARTVTAGDRTFDTGSIAGDATATFTAPSAPGSYPCICTIHPNMKGTLTVGPPIRPHPVFARSYSEVAAPALAKAGVTEHRKRLPFSLKVSAV